MRFGIHAEGIVDRLALASGQVPLPLLEGFWGLAVGNLLITATRLGIFESLAGGRKTTAQVAQETSCRAPVLEVVLNCLNGFGYLRRGGGRYWLTPKAEKWLVRKSSKSLCDSFLMMHEVAGRLAALESILKSGVTPDFHRSGQPSEFWRSYLRSLAPFASLVAPEIVRKTPLPKRPVRLLDVGGGHGVYSIAFCKKYPSLEATIIDLEEAATEGEQIVAEHGFGNRVVFQKGDLRKTAWGDDFDIVLLFNIIHNVARREVSGVLTRSYQALRPGGTVAILDAEHTGDEDNLSVTSGFSELVLFVLNGTRAYPQAEIKQWLRDAGFRGLHHRKLLTMPMTLFLTARR